MRKRIAFAFIAVLTGVLLFSPFLTFAAEKEKHDHHHHHHHAQAAKVEPVMNVETDPAELRAGAPSSLTFSIRDDNDKPVKDLTITHDRILHVVIVSADFESFGHIHPEDLGPVTKEMKEKAEYRVRYTFPRAGQYLVAVDYAVKDTHYSEQFILDVAGDTSMGAMKKDLTREKRFGDYRVKLASSLDPIAAGKGTTLSYTISKGDKEVTDLEPYLAAPMHIAVVLADLNQFIHVHGDRPGAVHEPHPAGHIHAAPATGNFGPEIVANVVFPVKGLYKIFSEVKHEGKVVVMDFMVEVK